MGVKDLFETGHRRFLVFWNWKVDGFAQEAIDLVLLDIMLPGENGGKS